VIDDGGGCVGGPGRSGDDLVKRVFRLDGSQLRVVGGI